ncbi:MAG: hypothetical protein ACXAD7_16910 [Candidatus Kariarchaeaceae archaeon]|jgi:hypothetical protein
MAGKPKFIIDDPKRAFKDIWRHHPELQNRFSSSWWFFLLLPKQKTGYGPKQLMFSFASRVGDKIKMNSTWQRGIDQARKLGRKEEFMTTVIGWISDGSRVHEEIIHQPAKATLSYDDRSLEAMERQNSGEIHGGRIEVDHHFEYGIKCEFRGKNGHGIFRIWNASDNDIDTPQIIDMRFPSNGKVGGVQVVVWRKFGFEGEFSHPNGTEHLSGIGYFQRVLMNVPMFPWKWCFLAFENGSTFSSFIPYIGLQAFRRFYKFYPQVIERAVLALGSGAYFYDQITTETTYFDSSSIFPVLNKGNYPDFAIHCKSKNGDFLKLKLLSHGHTQFLLDRPIIKSSWHSKFNYNEYMIKLVTIKGSINCLPFPSEKCGKAWGNMEYTWGLSL